MRTFTQQTNSGDGSRNGVKVTGMHRCQSGAGHRFALQVRFGESVRADLDRIRDLKIAGPRQGDGSPRLITLSQLASIVIEEGPAQISRENISRRITKEVGIQRK